ncbi:hypothetical protein [Mesorhizobium sp. SP-1A]|uniref:hypothetical protein n=1 Tax=Mesorhizobium sp. SP-1A TaxID=3077840 RepID=UPI0028F73E46|nr:hypothetical protein [Mesorhizobium sp. SP-1A]
MRLDINFDYTISFVRYRHQNPDVAHGRSNVEVEIRELSPSEAPLVAKIGQKTNSIQDEAKKFSFKKGEEPREIRFVDGRYFVEKYSVEEFSTCLEKGFEGTLFDKAHPRVSRAFEREIKYTTGEQILAAQPFGAPHRTISDDKGARMAKSLTKLAEQLLIVDGVVYEEIPEPVFTISKYTDKPSVTCRGQNSFSQFDYEEHSIYGLLSDRGDTTCNINLAHKHSQGGNRREMPHIEVFDPTVFTYDGDNRDTMLLAASLRNCLDKDAASLPLPYLQKWFDFRDAYEDAGNRVTDRLIAAVKEFCEIELSADLVEDIRIAAIREGDDRMYMYRVKSEDNLHSARQGVLRDDLDGIKSAAEKTLNRWDKRDDHETWPILSGPISSISIGQRNVMELGSKGHVVDCCKLSGMDLDAATRAVESGKRIIASIHAYATGNHAVATLDENDFIEIISPIDESLRVEMEGHFAEFVRVTNEARLKEEEMLAFETISLGS